MKPQPRKTNPFERGFFLISLKRHLSCPLRTPPITIRWHLHEEISDDHRSGHPGSGNSPALRARSHCRHVHRTSKNVHGYPAQRSVVGPFLVTVILAIAFSYAVDAKVGYAKLSTIQSSVPQNRRSNSNNCRAKTASDSRTAGQHSRNISFMDSRWWA
jgi:hypothetical protein